MWNFLNSVERPNIIEGVDAGRKTSVEAENLVVDQSSKG